MKQSYDSSLHTKTGLQNMVSGTFLSGTVSGGSSVSTGTGSSSGSSSSGSATGPGSSSGSSGSSAGLSSPIASISDHKTERVAATNGPGMAGDGFSSNNADGETAPVSSGTSNKSSGTTSSTAGTTSGSTSAPEAAQPEQLLVQPAAEEQVHRKWHFQQFGNFHGSGAAVCNRYFLCRYHHECGIRIGSQSIYSGVDDSAGTGQPGNRTQYFRNGVRLSGIL